MWLLTALLVAATPPPKALVARGRQAMGDAAAWANVHGVKLHAQVDAFSPGQSYAPFGTLQHVSAGEVDIIDDFSRATLGWKRRLLYPIPATLEQHEIMGEHAGSAGGKALSRGHWQARQLQLLTLLPRLLVLLDDEPKRLRPAPAIDDDGKKLDTVQWSDGELTLLVGFSPSSGLPARVRIPGADPLTGDGATDITYSNWTAEEGLRLPHTLSVVHDGNDVERFTLDDYALRANPPPGATLPLVTAGDPESFWARDREGRDGDAEAWSLEEVAPQTFIARTDDAASLVVEGANELTVVDAPLGEAGSATLLALLRERFHKPVRYFVLSHHHDDRSLGMRTVAASGATVIASIKAHGFVERVLNAPHKLAPDALARSKQHVPTLDVAPRRALDSGGRQLVLVTVPNEVHANTMLFVYVKDRDLAFCPDFVPATGTPSVDFVTAARAAGLGSQTKLFDGQGKALHLPL